MQVITDGVPEQLEQAYNAAEKTPEDWYCLSARIDPDLHKQHFKAVCNFLISCFGKNDGQILWDAGGAVFIFFQTPELEAVREHFPKFLESVRKHNTKPEHFDILNAKRDEQELEILIVAFLSGQSQKASNGTAYRFNELIVRRGKKLRSNRTKPVVLIVEDDPFTQTLITGALQSRCKALAAGTAKQAQILYQKNLPDIVFMDIELPDGDGEALTKAICAADKDANIIMLSAYSSKGKVMNCLEAGARSFITKPFKKERLLHFIDKYKAAAS